MTDATDAKTPALLIIDDDELMLDALGVLLSDIGTITTATSGLEGLQLAAAQPPDLILLDVEMPNMDGFAVCVALRETPALRDVPVILVTAHSSIEFETRGLDAGAVDFVAKPLHPAIIRRRVATHLALKQRTDELHRLASVDELTRVANRRIFDRTLDQDWRRSSRTSQPLSLALLDIDHFKKYNDHYGHVAGDACLRTVAAAIQGVARRSADLVARYGGEEFAVILPTTDAKTSARLGERILEAITDCKLPHEASPTSPQVTASLGMATIIFSEARSKGEAAQLAGKLGPIVALADSALYEAKSAGRNRMVAITRTVAELGESAISKA